MSAAISRRDCWQTAFLCSLRLFLDIGTNGEMALGNESGALCCAVASGPAFEGAGISCGMPGITGAVSHVSYDRGFLCDIASVELAGGFGNYLSPENVVRIGMLPRACLSKIRPLGNAALAGASMLALDGENWRKLAEIPEKCRYLELSGRDDFSRAFTDSLTF